MDRTWMRAPRISDQDCDGVEQFLQFVTHNSLSLRGNYFCPCLKCVNGRQQSIDEIRIHLICHNILLSYTKWIWHGELPYRPKVEKTVEVDKDAQDCVEDMIRDLGEENFQQAHVPMYDELQSDSKIHLYEDFSTFTSLSAVLALVKLKARFGWSDKSFMELLYLLKKMLPKDNTLLKSHYEAKKILCPIGMEYQKIHACPNDCVLYKNEFADLKNCPTCGVWLYKLNDNECTDDWFKNNSRTVKVCWYFQ